MKKTLIILLFISIVFSCDKTEPLPPHTYEINVSAKGVYNGIRTHLKVIDNNRREAIKNTAIIMNEVATFKGKVTNPSMINISVNGVKGNLPIILEPGRLNIEIYKDSILYSKVEGTDNNDVYNLFKAERKKKTDAITTIRKQVVEARKANDTFQFNTLRKKAMDLNKELPLFAHDFIDTHANSQFSLILLENIIQGKNQDIDKVKNNYKALKNIISKNNLNKATGKRIEAFINLKEAQSSLDIGKVAPNFSSTTPNGETLSLNDIKGKATIIDFWASWCKPCRIENPNVVKVYNKYHDKGLEIISVSLDREGQKARWQKAIEDDKLNWHHVASLKFWKEPVAKLYNITSIPATFILDEDGKIVAKSLRGDALEKQISKMLD